MEVQIISVLIICIFILCFTAVRQSKQYRSEIRDLKGKLSNKSNKLETLTLERQHYKHDINKLRNELSDCNKKLWRASKPVSGNPPPELDNSNPYWREISNYCKTEKRWTCEKCKINLKNDTYYLDTHHKLGRGYNSPQHLKVLCVECHAEEKTPMDHSFMKTDERYNKRYIAFVKKYRKHGR